MAADDPAPPPAGVAALHRPRRSLPVLVAPTLAAELNTLMLPALPLACWRLEAARFDFDSSVVRPEAEPELGQLAAMFDTVGGPALSVFGHADPVGDDEYNKALSGRRARAIYALLIRDSQAWSQLASSESWPPAAYAMMQARTGLPPGTPRDALFRAYMDAICHRGDGTPFSVDRTAFLGRGADPGGKADVQGCSEFNPILRFSQADEQALSDPSRKTERDARNAPNRRVLVFLFPSGMTVPPASWPCPRTTEGSSGCRAMFWPDGDHRRAAQDREREYARDKTTFACAFYDRMARRSPCELVRKTLRIRLLDPAGRPLPGARYQIKIGAVDVRQGTATPSTAPAAPGDPPPRDDGVAGWLTEDHVLAPSECELAYGPADTAGSPEQFPFKLRFSLEATDDSDEAHRRRLANLGYRPDDDLAVAITSFQRDYELTRTGQLDGPTRQRLVSAHDSGIPPPEHDEHG